MRPAGLGAVNLLDVVPVRLADWREDGDRVVLVRPPPRASWYLLPVEWLRWALAVRRIRLDAVGSAAWRACDGTRSAADIVPLIRSTFGADAEPIEQRMGVLIRRLRGEGLLAYRDHDDIPRAPGRAVSPPH